MRTVPILETAMSIACLCAVMVSSCARRSEQAFRTAEVMDFQLTTPLYDACASGDAEKIKALIDAGEDVGYAPGRLEYPLEIFCASGTGAGADSMRLLLDAGADPNDFKYVPPLFRTAQTLEHRNGETYEDGVEMVELLLEAGAEWVNPQDGNTILHYAALQKDAGLLNDLLGVREGKRLAHAKNSDGEEPTDWAMKRGNSEAAKALSRTDSESEG